MLVFKVSVMTFQYTSFNKFRYEKLTILPACTILMNGLRLNFLKYLQCGMKQKYKTQNDFIYMVLKN